MVTPHSDKKKPFNISQCMPRIDLETFKSQWLTSCFSNFSIWNPDWSRSHGSLVQECMWWSGPWVPCELVSTGSWLGSGSGAWASSGLTLSSIAKRHYFSNGISIIKKEERFNGQQNSQILLQISKRIVFSAEVMWLPGRRCQCVFFSMGASCI